MFLHEIGENRLTFQGFDPVHNRTSEIACNQLYLSVCAVLLGFEDGHSGAVELRKSEFFIGSDRFFQVRNDPEYAVDMFVTFG